MFERSKILESFVNTIESLSIRQKRNTWRLIDAGFILLACLIAYFIFYGVVRLSQQGYAFFYIGSLVLYFILARFLRIGKRITRYVSLTDIIILLFITFVSVMGSGVLTLLVFSTLSIRYTILSAFLSAIMVSGIRLLWQLIYQNRLVIRGQLIDTDPKQKTVLIGAGDGGALYIDSYKRNVTLEEIVAIIDDNEEKHGSYIQGIPVVGGLDDLPSLVREYGLQKAIVAIPSLTPEDYERILRACNDVNLSVYKMPKVEDLLLGRYVDHDSVEKINVADLLGRKEIELDESKLREELSGRVILITGAGGSIGSEISRQVAKYNPKKILLLGHGENSIYKIYHEHINSGHDSMTQFVPIIADIKDYNRMLSILQHYEPDIVYHTAAHKHVPLMEYNPVEALTNNILGTRNVARAVHEAGIHKMVLISTDKAIRPPNVMGASKRIAELIVTNMNEISDSQFALVRFGNVLGSRGSVVPAFQRMIKDGGPIRVTDFRMTRYFMTIPEASRLVIYAGAHSDEGEVFILDMDEPVKIVDLARKMIILSGHTEGEIGIVESGIRPGEKLYEEIMDSDELVDHELNDKIYIGKISKMPMEELDAFIESLFDIIDDDRLLKEKIIKFANESLNR